MKSENTQHKL